ncbi:IucA/IucC family C-terminal-domain containing protein [Kitasatospora sp. CM 4170]|uniref:(2Fe-2S)-binding protein n=1 Tax=Kitasatospora aburaviensis TaxID=67265 RepID=A0ABW1F3G5_9ACTN|nr:(2Fe-2S)-binding protein [Kitasatospora sp. CM 4170]WNM48939.1 IucA/IucC family C-terminal-domain containing protein [Kitasatospora sp. CM 4170]
MPDYRRLAVAGPYFALDTATAPTDTPPPGYRPLRELYATGSDSLLAARVREVARRLGTAEPRVAASILHLGLAARFCSVGLGAAVLLGTVPELDPDRAHVRIPEQGPIELWTPQRPQPAGEDASPGEAGPDRLPELADRLHRVLVQGQLAPLAVAVRAAVPLSERLLDGNAASALAGTLRMLRPHAAPGRAEALVAHLLERPPLAGTGTLHAGGFRRSSCCLYYRVGPAAGVCGDCCFTRPPRRS